MINKIFWYFKIFELERIGFDKYFFVVFDRHYSKGDHPFDEKVARENWQHRCYSRAKSKGRFVEVIRNENDYSFYELHLNGARYMFCYVNIIKYIQARKNISVDHNLIIHKDNFMPLEDKTLFSEYLEAKRDIEESFKELYRDIVKDFWKVDLEDICVKPSQLEIAYEVYPASVDDIANNFDANEVTYSRYNTQSGTIYLTDSMGKTDVRLPDGLSMRLEGEIDVTSEPGSSNFKPGSSQYVSRLNAGYSSDKIQIKFYRKSYGLVRIEFSIVNETIGKLNSAEEYISFLHKNMNNNLKFSEFVKRFDVTLESIIKNVACACGISEELCYSLKDIGIWESSRETISLMRKLRKRKLLIPITDDIGTVKKGKYKVAPWFQDIFVRFKPKGKELFLPGMIKRRSKNGVEVLQ